MYRLTRRSSGEELGTGSIAKPSSAASLKSSLGFKLDSFDTFSPSATSVLTFSSAAFASFSILPCPYFCWILRQNREADGSFIHRAARAISEDKEERFNFNSTSLKLWCVWRFLERAGSYQRDRGALLGLKPSGLLKKPDSALGLIQPMAIAGSVGA
jgi:hypothetical protein